MTVAVTIVVIVVRAIVVVVSAAIVAEHIALIKYHRCKVHRYEDNDVHNANSFIMPGRRTEQSNIQSRF